jgi:hypothetical protein
VTTYVNRVTKLKSAYGKITESIGGMGVNKIKLILGAREAIISLTNSQSDVKLQPLPPDDPKQR